VYANSAAKDSIPSPLGSQWNFPNQFGAFTIQKLKREGGNETPLECYYVLGGTIYKAPSLATLIRHRVLAAVKELDASLDRIIELSHWSLTRGYGWKGSVSADVKKEASDISGTDPSRLIYVKRRLPNAQRVIQQEYTHLLEELRKVQSIGSD